jgi:small subunit ribosomal protein S15
VFCGVWGKVRLEIDRPGSCLRLLAIHRSVVARVSARKYQHWNSLGRFMSITKERKTEVISEYRRAESDTGSPEVQIAVLTNRIVALTDHMKSHKHDHASRRGLLKLVSRRRRLLDYLRRTDADCYRDIIGRLSIRK